MKVFLLALHFISIPLGLSSLLPNLDTSLDPCDPNAESWGVYEPFFKDASGDLNDYLKEASSADTEWFLACALKTGNVTFAMIPYYIRFALDFLIQIIGLMIVAIIMVGAYYYIAGGVTDDKEKGKKIITYAIGGYALVLVSWVLVNVLLLALTS